MSAPNDAANPEHQEPSAVEASETSRPVLSAEGQGPHGGGADTKNESNQALFSPVEPSRPIAVTPPVPTSDDDDFIPRGKTTQTLAGGGKKAGRPH